MRDARAGPFIAAVVGLGAVWLVAGTLGIDPARLDLRTVLLLALVAGVAQRLPVTLFRSSAISVAFGATITTYVLYGVGVALWVNLVSAAVSALDALGGRHARRSDAQRAPAAAGCRGAIDLRRMRRQTAGGAEG